MSHPNPSNDDYAFQGNSTDKSQSDFVFMRGDEFLLRSNVDRLERIFNLPSAPKLDSSTGN
ncbi:hypothetical protein [Gloeobacter morelensis]|uniref:Uncharacterized protein n=1 Tax=Gloeobacter morelensis MG652769 TaxID=2781736 RepID=A0ABY3PJJ4_9CYAN|nr:hypothetical protein [Gloeobacter morelensis]UFP93808.1 hypothetical protein ISF26_18825 [Gloeobacter morelensis MG652769]